MSKNIFTKNPTSNNNAGSVMSNLINKRLHASIATQTPVVSPVNSNTGNLNSINSRKILDVPELSELNSLIHALNTPEVPAKPGEELRTLVALVLDESGSMTTGCKQTMDGYNDQLSTLRDNAKEIGCRVMQVNFSHNAGILIEDAKAEEIVKLSNETYSPGGGTALYDTVVAVVKKLLEHPDVHNENTSILLSITTDGDDTSSTVWVNKQNEFRKLMKAISLNDRWTVALAGPDLKLKEFADNMAVSRDNVAAFKPESVVSRGVAMASSSMAMNSYVSDRSKGMKKSNTLYEGTQAGELAKSILDN